MKGQQRYKFSPVGLNFRKILVVFLVLLLLPIALLYQRDTSKARGTLKEYENQKLSWSKCYGDFECTQMEVPVDYSNLTAGKFSIAALRYKAKDQVHRLGSLVVNPGGPGASGVDFAYNAPAIFSSEILSKYDIVGFDPRGVGASSAINCLTDKETDANYAADSKPDSPGELSKLIKEIKSYVAKCEAYTPNVLHFGTVDAARDMDLLRIALGDEKLNFLGVSYGTYLGTLYASLFPQKVGRVVLDGAVSPIASTVEQDISQAVGFDHALRAFVADCYNATDCPLLKPVARGIDQIREIFQRAALKPLLGTANRPVTESLVVLGVASALYDNESGWPTLRIALSQAMVGNGQAILALADGYASRNSKGGYDGNETDASFVIDCLDSQKYLSTEQIQIGAKEFARRAPIFGPYLAYSGIGCQFFMGDKEVVKPLSKISTVPVLIVGTTGDPATPYIWAQDLQKTLLGSRLLTLIGEGHAGYGRGIRCVDGAVDKYLLTGVLPKIGTSCKAGI